MAATGGRELAVARGGNSAQRRRAPHLTELAKDGRYVRTRPFPAFFTRGDRFVAVETDPDGVETLVIYGIG